MYNGHTVLDVHSHVSMPSFAAGQLAQMMGINSPIPNGLKPGVSTGLFQGRLVYANDAGAVPAKRQAELETFAADVQYHVEYLDSLGIDAQVVGPRPFITAGWVEPHIIPAWAEYINDLISMQCSLFPDRFYGAAQLPILHGAPDTSHALGELNRCVDELGFVSAYATPDPSGRRQTPGMHESFWYPLYQRCEQLKLPLIVHGSTSFDPRFRGIPHNYQMSFAIEQYIASQCLRWSDVFDRYPDLKIIICHCGSVLDRFLPYDAVHIPQKDLSNNLFYDSCSYNEIFLEAAIKQRGVDQICFGSEAPGSGSCLRQDDTGGRTADDLIPVIASFDFLTEDDKIKIFNGNVLKLFPSLAKTQARATA